MKNTRSVPQGCPYHNGDLVVIKPDPTRPDFKNIPIAPQILDGIDEIQLEEFGVIVTAGSGRSPFEISREEF